MRGVRGGFKKIELTVRVNSDTGDDVDIGPKKTLGDTKRRGKVISELSGRVCRSCKNKAHLGRRRRGHFRHFKVTGFAQTQSKKSGFRQTSRRMRSALEIRWIMGQEWKGY